MQTFIQRKSIAAALLALTAAFVFSTPASAQIYLGSGEIVAVDPTTGAITDTPTADGNIVYSLTVANGILYTASTGTDSSGNRDITVGTYNSTSLASVTPTLAVVPGIANNTVPTSVAVSGDNVYVTNATNGGSSVALINSSTGAVNDTFINDPDLIVGMAIANNVLYVSNFGGSVVATYDATTGALLNPDFIVLDDFNASGGYLTIANGIVYVVDLFGSTGEVGTYDIITGKAINPDFIVNVGGTPGDQPTALAISGNTLYLEDGTTGELGAYNAKTGVYEGGVAAAFSAGNIAINDPAPVLGPGPGGGSGFGDSPSAAPEPRSWILACAVVGVFFGFCRRFQRGIAL